MANICGVLVTVTLIGTVAACSASAPSSAATGGVTTETFTGMVASLGFDVSHTFIVTKPGPLNVKITLTQATWPGPLTGTSLAVSFGPIVTSGCLPILSATAQPGEAPQLTGSADPGTYCVGVADFQGRGPVTYTITVAHT